MNQDRLEMLMVKVVDEVASPSEREELMGLLHQRPGLLSEYESHLALKATTDQLVARLDVDLVSDHHAARPSVALEVAMGWLLFFVGLALVVGYVVYHFLSTPDVPLILRLGIAAISAGGLVLLASAIRARLAVRGVDRYSEVIR